MVSVLSTRGGRAQAGGGLFKSVALRSGEKEWRRSGNLMSKEQGKESSVSVGKGRESCPKRKGDWRRKERKWKNQSQKSRSITCGGLGLSSAPCLSHRVVAGLGDWSGFTRCEESDKGLLGICRASIGTEDAIPIGSNS